MMHFCPAHSAGNLRKLQALCSSRMPSSSNAMGVIPTGAFTLNVTMPSPHGTAAPPSLGGMGTMSDRSENLAFGQRIRAAMAVARVSRQDVARACGISPQGVQRWCDGTSYPTSSKLIIFCNMTGCSAEWLLWPHPVDIRSTDWAINGTHIKNIVRQCMDDLAAEPPTPQDEPGPVDPGRRG